MVRVDCKTPWLAKGRCNNVFKEDRLRRWRRKRPTASEERSKYFLYFTFETAFKLISSYEYRPSMRSETQWRRRKGCSNNGMADSDFTFEF